MPNNIPNSTDYVHLNESNLVNLHKAMTYNTAGEPVIRIIGGNDTVALDASTLTALETITVDGINNPVVISDGDSSITVDGAVSINGTVALAPDTSITVDGAVSINGTVALAPDTSIVTASGKVSTDNATSSPLLADAVYTGSWEDVSAYGSAVIAVATDQDGIFQVQFSTDGINVDSALTRYYRTGQIEAPHRFTITRRFLRVIYTNDATNQTFFRLQVLLGSKSELNAPIDSTLAQDFDSIVVRPTVADDELVLGLRQGSSANLKFGYNENVSAGVAEVVASFGGTFVPLTTASSLTLVSSSNNDVAITGTGAHSLYITGINANRRAQAEFINLNGTTPVVTSNTWLGVTRIVVFSSGANLVNAGNIAVTATTNGSNQAYIPATTNITQQCIFFVEDGHQGLIRRIALNVLKLANGTAPVTTVYLKVYNPKITQSTYTLRRWKMDADVTNDIVRTYNPPIKLDPTDVAWLEIVSDQNNTSIDAEFDIIAVKQQPTSST